jgi:hypothetical protein
MPLGVRLRPPDVTCLFAWHVPKELRRPYVVEEAEDSFRRPRLANLVEMRTNVECPITDFHEIHEVPSLNGTEDFEWL